MKLKSRKVLITLWAIGMVTYIVVTGKVDFIPLATLLSTVPLAYIGANTYQKTHLGDTSGANSINNKLQ